MTSDRKLKASRNEGSTGPERLVVKDCFFPWADRKKADLQGEGGVGLDWPELDFGTEVCRVAELDKCVEWERYTSV